MYHRDLNVWREGIELVKMTYKLSGDFNEKFGEGFFDEASKWDMVIIRKEFELNKKNRK